MPVWIQITGYKYEVSERGAVRSLHRQPPKTLVPRRHTNGYLNVNLSRDGKASNKYIHILVAEAFLGPRPPGMDVCHNDGDKTNNCVTNLRYASRSENILDSVKAGAHYAASRTHCPRNHPYDSANTYVNPTTGGRVCRTCRNDTVRRWKRNQKIKQDQQKENTQDVHGELYSCQHSTDPQRH